MTRQQPVSGRGSDQFDEPSAKAASATGVHAEPTRTNEDGQQRTGRSLTPNPARQPTSTS